MTSIEVHRQHYNGNRARRSRQPLAFSIIRDEFPRGRVPHGIALISAILGIGGGLGIVLAGPIVQHFDYH